MYNVPYELSIRQFANMKLILLLISVLPGLAQHANQAILEFPEPQSTDCSSTQIKSMTVTADCTCSGDNYNYPRKIYSCPNPTRQITAKSGLRDGILCSDPNAACNSCYLYFHNLCSCIKKMRFDPYPDPDPDPTHTHCKSSVPIEPAPKNVPTVPVWMLLEGHHLITTNWLLTGIEQLHLLPAAYQDEGWRLGQRNYVKATQALAMNSMASRTEEQIHIHVCDIKDPPCGYPSGRTREILSCLSRDSQTRAHYSTMKPVPLMLGDTVCKVSSKPHEMIDIAGDITNEIKNKDCAVYTGAGIMTDNYNFTWACVTDSTVAAEYIFCN